MHGTRKREDGVETRKSVQDRASRSTIARSNSSRLSWTRAHARARYFRMTRNDLSSRRWSVCETCWCAGRARTRAPARAPQPAPVLEKRSVNSAEKVRSNSSSHRRSFTLRFSLSLSLWLLVFHVRGTPGFFSILPLFVSVFSNNFPGDYVICPWNAGIGRDKALPREQHRFSITDSEDLMQQGRSILSVYSDEITDAKCLVPWMTILVITRKHASIRTLWSITVETEYVNAIEV